MHSRKSVSYDNRTYYNLRDAIWFSSSVTRSHVHSVAIGCRNSEAVSAVLKEESKRIEQKAGRERVKLETIRGASLTPRMPNCERKRARNQILRTLTTWWP